MQPAFSREVLGGRIDARGIKRRRTDSRGTDLGVTDLGWRRYGRIIPAQVIILLLLLGCAAITPYDPTSYKTATDLKAESLALMDKATEPPEPHQAQIDDVRLKLEKAYQYEAGKGKANRMTVKQWRLLKNPEGALLGGFLNKWEDKGEGFSAAFVEGAKKNVAGAFDEIIKLESHKVKE